MASAIRNNIRSVQPQKMIYTVLHTQRSRFLKRQIAAIDCVRPVPSKLEKHLASLVPRSHGYQGSVKVISGTHQNGSKWAKTDRRISNEAGCAEWYAAIAPKVLQSCAKVTRFPCLHGIAVLSAKFVVSNLHQFVAERHLTKKWKKQYDNCTFQLPPQSCVDEVILSAMKLVVSGNNLHAPKAIPRLRGRPVKNAGKKPKGWYEKGPEPRKKRSFFWSNFSNLFRDIIFSNPAPGTYFERAFSINLWVWEICNVNLVSSCFLN